MNAIAERWVQGIQQECLDHFAVFGIDHLKYLIAEYLEYYHHERPHQGVGNRTRRVGIFDALFEPDGIDVRPVGPVAPNMNAIAERWVQSIGQECLDQFAVFGMDHLKYLIAEYLAHYHEERPHQGVGNRLLTRPQPEPTGPLTASEVACDERLGGLLKHYRQVA